MDRSPTARLPTARICRRRCPKKSWRRKSGQLTDDLKERIALRRIAIPLEIASCCLFLVSDETSFVTGAVPMVVTVPRPRNRAVNARSRQAPTCANARVAGAIRACRDIKLARMTSRL
ncbi:MAG: SDR family oxidoreductase [Methylocystis sp.]